VLIQVQLKISFYFITIGITHEEILSQGLIIFVAAYETTSSAISLMSYNLALNPEVQEKLYQHIVENLGIEVDGFYNIFLPINFYSKLRKFYIIASMFEYEGKM